MVHVLRSARNILLAGGTAVAVLVPALMITGPAGAQARLGQRAGRAAVRPAFSVGGFLRGVAATSASNAWAVRLFPRHRATGSRDRALEQLAWKSVKSPNPTSAGTSLFSVDALSASQAWAVGETGSGPRPLHRALERHGLGSGRRADPGLRPARRRGRRLGHQRLGRRRDRHRPLANPALNGTKWSAGDRPDQSGTTTSSGVSPRCRRRTPGLAGSSDSGNTQILHWNGTKWSTVATPDVSGSDFLLGIAAASATSAWAVG